MFRRLLIGLVLGLVVGGLLAAGLVGGLHQLVFDETTGGAFFAYVAAALTGVVTGLVAGKPIWSSGAKIEAGLKAFFGALIAAGLMFALRQWAGGFQVPVTSITPDSLPIGELPAVALPVIAALLGGFFELDNTGGDDKDDKKKDAPADRKRVAEGANGKSKARVADGDDDADEPAAAAPKRAKR
ncbi:MAG TPA: hypothetical protein VIF15_14155 [Polyangiaceae bacterium]|jgi:hypothetical protein